MSIFYSGRRMEELKISQRLAPEYTQLKLNTDYNGVSMLWRIAIQYSAIESSLLIQIPYYNYKYKQKGEWFISRYKYNTKPICNGCSRPPYAPRPLTPHQYRGEPAT